MAIDRRFIPKLRLVVSAISNSKPSSTSLAKCYIVGNNPTGDFAKFQVNSIIQAVRSGESYAYNLVFSPVWGDVVFCEADNSFLRFEGDEGWKVVATCEDSSQGIPTCEKHILTADEANAKSFSLSNSINSGDENNVICLVENVAQTVKTDFTVSGDTISWNKKGLDDIGLYAGDTFIVLYNKAKS